MRDEVQASWRESPPLIVTSVDADELGALTILLEGAGRIEVIPDRADEGELWRFFRPHGGDDHLVLTAPGPLLVRDSPSSQLGSG